MPRRRGSLSVWQRARFTAAPQSRFPRASFPSGSSHTLASLSESNFCTRYNSPWRIKFRWIVSSSRPDEVIANQPGPVRTRSTSWQLYQPRSGPRIGCDAHRCSAFRQCPGMTLGPPQSHAATQLGPRLPRRARPPRRARRHAASAMPIVANPSTSSSARRIRASSPATPNSKLAEDQFVEGRNVAIEYHWRNSRYESPARRSPRTWSAFRGGVSFADRHDRTANTPATLAAKAATTTIPMSSPAALIQ